MKYITKISTWLLKLIAFLLVLIILTSLTFKMFSPPMSKPIGKIVNIGNTNLHIIAAGKKSKNPTVIIEGGSGMSTEYYHWLDEGLKDSLRVIRYDRAGIGHSNELNSPRDPETVAKELHSLLEKTNEKPPYIMVGHSLGGPFVRVFSQMYLDEVDAMFFVDATHHQQVERFGAPKKSSFKFKIFRILTEIQAISADLGFFILYDKVFGNPYEGAGLPDEINKQVNEYLSNGKTFRAYKEELKNYHSILKRSGKASDFGDIPIRSFVAVNTKTHHDNQPEKDYLDFEDLSKNGKRIEIVGSHTSIFTKKENAKIICKEIIKVANETSKGRK